MLVAETLGVQDFLLAFIQCNILSMIYHSKDHTYFFNYEPLQTVLNFARQFFKIMVVFRALCL